MMLRVVGEESLPGVEARWVDASAHLDSECGCEPRSTALVVSPVGMGLWVCCAVAPVRAGDEAWRDAVLEMEGEDGELAVARCAAAFGMPWAELTETMMRAQLVLLMHGGESLYEQLRASSPEELVALRDAVWPGKPADVVRALRCVHEYAAATQ